MSACHPRPRAALPFCLCFALLGCDVERTPTEPEPRASAPAVAVEPALAPPPAIERGVVRELTLGDRACYLDIEDSAGQLHGLMGRMELCEQAQLIGHAVRLEFERGDVIAESCMGDPECRESETVWLVREIAP